MKKLNVLMVTLLLSAMIFSPVSYANEMSVVNKLGNLDIQYSTRSLDHIMSVRSEIKDIGHGNIYIKAGTKADQKVDYLKLNITLEKWNGRSWKSVKKWTSDSSHNKDNISYTTVYKGKIGQKYRVKTTHALKENSVPEVEETITASIELK
ncbi:hypothetical protein [Crassaminicella profunda]|uniref:hypothetical protein n=1 Tax=Crassaminicella profunda TaxID=1286698 RepID=UPI001CA7B434|nr:hypothetical protein [Crassaminicella profunda]QZY54907.1 hypothetical protein K7H06_18090 [Crassaminicella profunda]